MENGQDGGLLYSENEFEVWYLTSTDPGWKQCELTYLNNK